MRREVADTLQQAREDLQTAEVLRGAGRYYAAAFFAQQVAEKGLKALHLASLHQVPFTHNLVELARALDAPDSVLHAARVLNPKYTTTRYADAANGVPAEMFDEPTASEALSLAHEVLAWVGERMAALEGG